LIKKFGGNKKLGPKAKADLMEIEKMMQGLGDLGNSLGGLPKGQKR
jgi:hypothetical protein